MNPDAWLNTPDPTAAAPPPSSPAAAPPASGPSPDAWLTDTSTPATPAPAAPSTGLGWSDIPGALWSGIRHGIGDLGQTAAGDNVGNAISGAPSPAAAPYQWSDIIHPGSALSKFAYRMGESSPTLAAGIGAGAAGTAATGNPFVGIGAGALGAGGMAALQEIGPAFHRELLATPNDPDGAWDRALHQAALTGVFSGAAWAAFPLKFFNGPIKNAAFQIFGVQPGLAVGHQAASNLEEGKPLLQGAPNAYVEGAVGTALPMAGHAGVMSMTGRGGAAAQIIGDKATDGEPPTPDELLDVARGHYDDIEEMNPQYRNLAELQKLQDELRSGLYQEGGDRRRVPGIFRAIDDLTQSRFPERMIAPALKIGDDVFSGDDAMEQAARVHGYGAAEMATQGYMTSRGRFVTHPEAMKLATKVGQDLNAPLPGYVDFTDIDHVRRILNGIMVDNSVSAPDTSRLAGMAIHQLDAWLEDPDRQMDAGLDPVTANALASKAAAARSYWRAGKGMEAFNQIIEKAENASNAREVVFRNEIRKIVNNPKLQWQYPPEAIDLMRQGLHRGFWQAAAHATKLFDPHSSFGLFTNFMSHSMFGPEGLLAMPLAMGARYIGQRPLKRVEKYVPRMIAAAPTGARWQGPTLAERTAAGYSPYVAPVTPQQQAAGGAIGRALRIAHRADGGDLDQGDQDVVATPPPVDPDDPHVPVSADAGYLAHPNEEPAAVPSPLSSFLSDVGQDYRSNVGNSIGLMGQGLTDIGQGKSFTGTGEALAGGMGYLASPFTTATDALVQWPAAAIGGPETGERAAFVAGLPFGGEGDVGTLAAHAPEAMFFGLRHAPREMTMTTVPKAVNMERAGASPEEVWNETGLFREPSPASGPPGAWRYEVLGPTSMGITPTDLMNDAGKPYMLRDILNAPHLWNQVPEPKGIRAFFGSAPDIGDMKVDTSINNPGPPIPADTDAYYQPYQRTLGMPSNPYIWLRPYRTFQGAKGLFTPIDDPLAILYHETQHAFDQPAGLLQTVGGADWYDAGLAADLKGKEPNDLYKGFQKLLSSGMPTDMALRAVEFDRYRRSPPEIMARLSEERMGRYNALRNAGLAKKADAYAKEFPLKYMDVMPGKAIAGTYIPRRRGGAVGNALRLAKKRHATYIN